jgi:hypothetical protein
VTSCKDTAARHVLDNPSLVLEDLLYRLRVKCTGRTTPSQEDHACVKELISAVHERYDEKARAESEELRSALYFPGETVIRSAPPILFKDGEDNPAGFLCEPALPLVCLLLDSFFLELSTYYRHSDSHCLHLDLSRRARRRGSRTLPRM